MKKLLALLLTLAMLLSCVGCDILSEGLGNAISGIFGGECEHNFVATGSYRPDCESEGTRYLKCEKCGEKSEEPIPAGHTFGEGYEPSRFGTCTVCSRKISVIPTEGKYSDKLDFTFGEDDKAALSAVHNEIKTALESAEAYDPALHGLTDSGALYDEYKALEAKYEEYTDLVYDAQGQSSIAMTLYYCDMNDDGLKAQYDEMQSFYTQLVSDYYSLSQPWYDSKYRDFFFEGATEEEIKAFLFDSNAYANPEYTALKDRNDKIELEYYDITNPVSDQQVAVLYAEFVENNNKIAALLGYDNYLEYAYENVYNRDYTYQDVAEIYDYIKTYVTPVFNSLYDKWSNIPGLTNADIQEYYNVVSNSFFNNERANELFNNYIDDMDMRFSSNEEKQYSFSDCLNGLITDGNLFRGTYEGAYVTYIFSEDIPIAYFGANYDDSTTVAHEFGHYMNEIYNRSEYDQSYDLLETHSQGHEMLYMYYASGKVNGVAAYMLVNTYQQLNITNTIMLSTQVDRFEQAVYLGEYDGPYSDSIMADGRITYDEYDLLYAGISEDLGIKKDYRADDYWRYGMTIASPCYYVSYAVSGINALQIYTKIRQEGFDAAKESYLKLFTYTDVDPEMSDLEILAYAGLKSYLDEEAYVNIKRYCGQ